MNHHRGNSTRRYAATIGPKAAAVAVGLLMLVGLAVARAHSLDEHWIEKRLRQHDYSLSAAEKEGLYFCSLREVKVLNVEIDKGFATVISYSSAPRFFKLTEVAAPLMAKLLGVVTGQTINLLCVHSFFRDDWQARYDEEGTVHHKLVDLDVIEDAHVYLTW